MKSPSKILQLLLPQPVTISGSVAGVIGSSVALYIDLLLKEAGWPLDKPQDREYPVTGMPNEKGGGLVDYVLWSDNGKPLGLVEAKRTKRDARVGQRQAELYANCLEKQFRQRPIIFYSNGYEHWIWDDVNYPPRSVQGFYKKDELERLIQRRGTRSSLGRGEINEKIVERFYQHRAIRRIGEAFEKDHERKALVVMATGAGKTRAVVALCDLMMRCNWVKRVLFLADRIALVRQTTNVFKAQLPSAGAVNVLEHPEQIAEARVQVKHVACANEAWAKKLKGEKPLPAHCDTGGPNPAKSKSEILAYLKQTFQMLDDGIAATTSDNLLQPVTGPYAGNNRLEVVNSALWHTTDHYGQLVVYLRMNGAVPPASR